MIDFLVMLIILNCLDLLSTVYFLNFTNMHEGNPLVNHFYQKYGDVILILMKLVVIIPILLLMMYKKKLDKHWINHFMIKTVNIVYIMIVMNNVNGIVLWHIINGF